MSEREEQFEPPAGADEGEEAWTDEPFSDECESEDGEQETSEGTEQSGRISPIKAIRRKCLDCSGGSSKEVSLCDVVRCALHPFRFGRNPFRTKREMSEEQKAAAAERLREARLRRSQDECKSLMDIVGD